VAYAIACSRFFASSAMSPVAATGSRNCRRLGRSRAASAAAERSLLEHCFRAAAGFALERVTANGQAAGSVVAIEPKGDSQRGRLGRASAVDLRFSRSAFFFFLRSFRQRLTDLEPRPIARH
jgi:hypothetical protein